MMKYIPIVYLTHKDTLMIYMFILKLKIKIKKNIDSEN